MLTRNPGIFKFVALTFFVLTFYYYIYAIAMDFYYTVSQIIIKMLSFCIFRLYCHDGMKKYQQIDIHRNKTTHDVVNST